MSLSLLRRGWVVTLMAVVIVAAAGLIAWNRSHAPDGKQAPAGASQVALASSAGAKGDAKEGEAGGEDKDGKTPVPVSVVPVGVGPVSSYISATANLVPENEVKVLAEAEGRVAELLVEEGDRVRVGQVLAALVRDDAEIALKKAELRAANAGMAFERARTVVAENLMSREDFDRITMENDVAQQELAEARWKLEKTTIRAPFTGRLTHRDTQLGQHVRPGDTLFTVSDFDPLIARIFLPEKDVLGLETGRDVRITLKADEQTRFNGRIQQISPVVDTQTGTVKVTVEATHPPDGVRPGAFITIDIVRETHPKAVLLPRESVVRELREAYVFIVKDGAAERRAVVTGLEEGGRVEALSGVAIGEQVITAGQGGLKDGSPVKVMPAPEASDLGAPNDRPRRS